MLCRHDKRLTRRQFLGAFAALSGMAASSAVSANSFNLVYRVNGMVMPDKSDFTTHTFTTAGKTGRVGPALADCQAAYAGSEILKPVYQFNVISGIQTFIIPADGRYRITAHGAQGSNKNGNVGRGAILRGDFDLKSGDKLFILVGQRSIYTGTRDWQGGSGGSFVAIGSGLSNAQPLVVAGGGGTNRSSSAFDARMDANTGTAGKTGTGSAGGRNGSAASGGGHNQDSSGGGAAGFYGNGRAKGDLRQLPPGYSGYKPAYSFRNGGLGGEFETNYDPGNPLHGGFGGGGPGGWGGAGGGGGYSGGGNCKNTGYSGGGGSFIAAEAREVATSNGTFSVSGSEPTPAYKGPVSNIGRFHSGEGLVIIERLADV
jgi:hypothetical protein